MRAMLVELFLALANFTLAKEALAEAMEFHGGSEETYRKRKAAKAAVEDARERLAKAYLTGTKAWEEFSDKET